MMYICKVDSCLINFFSYGHLRLAYPTILQLVSCPLHIAYCALLGCQDWHYLILKVWSKCYIKLITLLHKKHSLTIYFVILRVHLMIKCLSCQLNMLLIRLYCPFWSSDIWTRNVAEHSLRCPVRNFCGCLTVWKQNNLKSIQFLINHRSIDFLPQ